MKFSLYLVHSTTYSWKMCCTIEQSYIGHIWYDKLFLLVNLEGWLLIKRLRWPNHRGAFLAFWRFLKGTMVVGRDFTETSDLRVWPQNTIWLHRLIDLGHEKLVPCDQNFDLLLLHLFKLLNHRVNRVSFAVGVQKRVVK